MTIHGTDTTHTTHSTDATHTIHSTHSTDTTAFRAIQALTDQAKCLALEHDFAGLKTCMNHVQKMYKSGNTAVRNAVENIFVFAFSSILPHCNQVEWHLVQSCMPAELYSLYIRQIMRSTC